MVSAVLGKKGFIKCNYFNVYPNLYIVLASMPGVGKKSTAIRTGRECLYDAEAEVRYSNDSQTPQALMIELDKAFNIATLPSGKFFGSAPLTVIASELVSLLSAGQAMVEFLTDIYDSDKKFEYKTKNMGCLTVKNPCLNLIAGVTTDSLNTRIIRDASAGGLMSRIVTVYDNEVRAASAFDLPSPQQLHSRQKVVDRLKLVENVYGEFSFTKSAIQLYQELEIKEHTAMSKITSNAEFRSRKPIHILKAAMLLAASELRTKIEDLDVSIAIELLERVEHNMKFIHMSAGTHKNAEIHSRIILALGKVGSVDYADMLTHFMTSTDEDTFRKSVETLINVQWVKIEKTKDENGKATRATLFLTDKGKEKFMKFQGKI
jgi:hypothetical protein